VKTSRNAIAYVNLKEFELFEKRKTKNDCANKVSSACDKIIGVLNEIKGEIK